MQQRLGSRAEDMLVLQLPQNTTKTGRVVPVAFRGDFPPSERMRFLQHKLQNRARCSTRYRRAACASMSLYVMYDHGCEQQNALEL